jgi:hypothetical protein
LRILARPSALDLQVKGKTIHLPVRAGRADALYAP